MQDGFLNNAPCTIDTRWPVSNRPWLLQQWKASQIVTRACGLCESLRFPMQNQKSRINSKLLTHGFRQLGHCCRCFFVLFLEGRRKDSHVGNTFQICMNTMGLLQLSLSPFFSYVKMCLSMMKGMKKISHYSYTISWSQRRDLGAIKEGALLLEVHVCRSDLI